MPFSFPDHSSHGASPGRLAVLKLFLKLYVPMVLVLGGLLYGFLGISAKLSLQDIEVKEAGEVKVATELLSHDFWLVSSDLQVLSRASSLLRYLDSGGREEKARLTQLFQTMSGEKRIYDQIRYCDARGMEVIRVDWKAGAAQVVPDAELQDKGKRYFFRDSFSLKSGEIYVSPLDLNIEHGKVELPYKPMLRFGTPVFDSAGRKKGVLLVNYLGSEILRDFQRAMVEKKHAMLLNHDGYWLSSPDTGQEWGFMLGRDQRFGKTYPAEWQRISRLDKGSFLTDKGLFTFATVYPLLAGQYSSTGSPFPTGQSERMLTARQQNWKIVSLVKAEDLPAASLAQFPRTAGLFLFALLLLAFLAGYLAVTLLSRRQLRQAVAENEARLQEIAATLGEGVYVINELGCITYANPEAEKLLGWSGSELIGQHAHNLFHHSSPDGSPLDESACVINRVIRSGQVYRGDTEVFWRRDGTPLQVAVSSSPIVRDGKNAGSVVAFSDIGERKRIQERLLRNTHQLTEAQHLAHVGSWELDLASKALSWSEEIFQIFEIDPAVFGASYDAFLSAVHPEDRAQVDRAYRDSLENHEPYCIEHRLLFPGGRIKYVLERGESFYDAAGRPQRSVGTVQDISESKRTEAALRQSEERGRALLNATSETAMLMDRDGVVLAINETGAWRFGKKPAEMVGQNLYSILPPDLAASRAERVNEVFRSGLPLHLQDQRDENCFDTNIYPILDVDGKVFQVAVYAADITEKTRLQAVDTLLHEIDQQVTRSKSLAPLLHFICADIVRLFGYPFAWIGRKSADGSVTISAWAGVAKGYHGELAQLGVRWDDTPQGQGPTGTSIRSGHAQVFRIGDPAFHPWRESAERYGLKSIIGIPLIIRGEVYGAFSLYSQHEHSFDDPATLQRLNNIAGRICVALENALDQEQLRLLGTALSSAGNGVFITDRRGRIRWVNASFTRLTGFAPEEAVGETPSILKSGKQDIAYYQSLWKTVLNGEVWSSETVERRRDGSLFTVQQTITPIRGEEGEITHFISILEDITAQKETEARIHRMAHFDALTDLPNRALFYDRLQQVLAQAKRGGHSSALMFLDLDRFKTVNDTLGHHVGDLLLQEVARRVRACVRESDTVARLGGDEFTVLLHEVVDRESAAIVARKIIAAFVEPFQLDGHELRSSTSIGISLYPLDADECEELVKCADSAMYEAKQQGRNNYRFFDASSPDSL